MLKISYVLAVPILSGIVALAAASSGPSVARDMNLRPADAISCAVRVSRTTGGVELEAVASAERNATGAFRFLIEKRGPGGASTVSQGGGFLLARGEEQSLGKAGVGLERRASYSASLILENERGMPLCEAEQSM